jgi:hypothetical protein
LRQILTPPTKPEICQGHLGNNNTGAIEIGEARSHPEFLAVTLRQLTKPISVTRYQRFEFSSTLAFRF